MTLHAPVDFRLVSCPKAPESAPTRLELQLKALNKLDGVYSDPRSVAFVVSEEQPATLSESCENSCGSLSAWDHFSKGSVMANHIYQNDLPDGLDLGPVVAIDCETMGLVPGRDRLCLIQMSGGDGDCHLIQVAIGQTEAPNLVAMLENPNVLKLFHYGRFDIAAMLETFGVVTAPVYCTKIASRLVRTFTDRHGLKTLIQTMLGIDISKHQQQSDWGAPVLTAAQLDYAASDVLYLHQLRDAFDVMLAREGRTEMAQACFDFLPMRAQLDIAGWPDSDIFAHS